VIGYISAARHLRQPQDGGDRRGRTAKPASPDPEVPRVSLTALVRACGFEQLHEPDPFDAGAVRDAILCAVAEDRVGAVLLSTGCPASCCTDPRRSSDPP